MAEFAYSPMFPLAVDTTEYELVTSDHVKLVKIDGEKFLRVAPEGLTELAQRAFTDISHLLRSSHLANAPNFNNKLTCQTLRLKGP